jgi:hypothetical protein
MSSTPMIQLGDQVTDELALIFLFYSLDQCRTQQRKLELAKRRQESAERKSSTFPPAYDSPP